MKIVGITLGIILLVAAGFFAVHQIQNPEDTTAIEQVIEQEQQAEEQTQVQPETSQPVEQPVVEDNTKFTSDFFKTISDTVTYGNATILASAPSITGDVEVDAYIHAKAEARGYKMRPVATDESQLIALQGQRLQQAASISLKKLQAAAKKQGLTITFVSGYRSPSYQQGIVTKKLGTYNKENLLAGKMDAQLDAILKVSSIPGYSKHHSGYTIDIACNSYELTNAFMQTDCYKWLAKDNFKNARAYNFIPSYPVGIENQGPDPESWEFIWVPSDLLK